jgi:hypothetical protein
VTSKCTCILFLYLFMVGILEAAGLYMFQQTVIFKLLSEKEHQKGPDERNVFHVRWRVW